MIGYRSVQHQGWAGAKRNVGVADSEHCPYPHGCAASYEYYDGCNAFRRGDVIDRSGRIEKPTQAAKEMYYG